MFSLHKPRINHMQRSALLEKKRQELQVVPSPAATQEQHQPAVAVQEQQSDPVRSGVKGIVITPSNVFKRKEEQPARQRPAADERIEEYELWDIVPIKLSRGDERFADPIRHADWERYVASIYLRRRGWDVLEWRDGSTDGPFPQPMGRVCIAKLARTPEVTYHLWYG